MVKVNDYSTVDDYLKQTSPDPATNPSAIVSQSLRDFYIRDRTDLMKLDVALCDWGSASWINNHLTEVIQPILLRAPEVMIGAPWGPKADIWNLGAVILEVLDAVRLFNGRANQTGGEYRVQHHLFKMVALFGPFPHELLAQGDQVFVDKYFDERGRIRDPIPRPSPRLENWIVSLTGEDKAEFVALLYAMLKIDPKCRPSAKELLSERWFQHE